MPPVDPVSVALWPCGLAILFVSWIIVLKRRLSTLSWLQPWITIGMIATILLSTVLAGTSGMFLLFVSLPWLLIRRTVVMVELLLLTYNSILLGYLYWYVRRDEQALPGGVTYDD